LTTLEAAHDGAAASRASFRHPTQLPNSSNEGEKRKQIVSFDKKKHARSIFDEARFQSSPHSFAAQVANGM